MHDSPFPVLTHFVSAYLHQDWDLEYASKSEALDDFVENDSNGRRLLDEVDRALAVPEVELGEEEFARFARTSSESPHGWLTALRKQLIARPGSDTA